MRLSGEQGGPSGLAEAIEQSGGRAAVFVADVSDEDAVRGMVEGVVDVFGRLDVVRLSLFLLLVLVWVVLTSFRWSQTLG